jgi:predicted dehydrogenase
MISAAVIGMGYWGPMVVQSLNGSSDKIRVTRAVDIEPDRAKEFCASRRIKLSASLDDALGDKKIDAVVLCTPHSLHESQIAAAAAAGKHVFCEKPLALTKASAGRAVAACKAAGVTLGVGHERRFERPFVEIRRLAAAGDLGTLLHLEANFSHDKFVGRPAGHWRYSKSEGPSPPMTGMGIHLTDSFVALAGRVARLRAVSASPVPEPPRNVIAIQLEFASGATGFVTAVSATPYYGRFTVLGSEGWAESTEDEHPERPVPNRLTFRPRGGEKSVTDFEPFDIVRANFEAFADAAEGRAAYPISAAEMIHNAAILDAVGRSIAVRGAVAVA